MTRLEVTESELSLLHDLLEANRYEARLLMIKGGVPSSPLTRSDRLIDEIKAAKRRRAPDQRIK